MERPKFDKFRKYAALGGAVVALASAGSAEAKPNTQGFPLGKSQLGKVFIDSKAQVAGTYLQSDNIQQSMEDAFELGLESPEMSVSVTTGGKTSRLDFVLDQNTVPWHYFYVVPNEASIPMASAGLLDEPGTVQDDRGFSKNQMESYIFPVDNSIESDYGVNENIQNMAKNAAFSVLGVDFSGMAPLINILGPQIDGAQYLEMRNAVKGALSLSFAIAEGAKSASMSYADYKLAIATAPYSYTLQGQVGAKLQISLPPIPRSSYYSLGPLKLAIAA